MTRLDPRLPEDKTDPIGGTIGLEDTPFAGYQITHDLSGSYMAFYCTSPRTAYDPAQWSLVGIESSLSDALDAIQLHQNERGLAPADGGAPDAA